MKAQNLKEAYKTFALTPLEETETMNSFYIPRGENLVSRLSTLGDDGIKILFSGQRGAGKTTELNYTAHKLSAQYHVFNLKIGKDLNVENPCVMDILSVVFRKIEYLVNGPKPVKGRIERSPDGVRTLVPIPDPKEKSPTTINDYIYHLNELFEKLRMDTGKGVLLFIDDLDKSIHRIEEILLKEGDVFSKLTCSLVLTVPLTTVYSSMINRITEWFHHVEVLPLINLADRDGKKIPLGMATLKELVLRRMEADLISVDALEKAVFYSGGVFRYLVKIMQDSAFKALIANEDCIVIDHIECSATTMRSEFGRIIGFKDYKLLHEIHKRKSLINLEHDVRFIANDIVLEYQNGTRWVDIHPVVMDLLPAD